MKLTGMMAALLTLAVAGCEKPTAGNRAPEPSADGAAGPREPQIAAPGNYFLRRAVSVETDAGIAGYPPGTALRETGKGRYRTADGRTLKLTVAEVTNDLGEARALAGRDAAAQAALARVPVGRAATPAVAGVAPAVAPTGALRDAAPPARQVADAPTPAPLGAGSPLNRGAYGRTQTFVDTDGDGRKFDTRQKSRTR